MQPPIWKKNVQVEGFADRNKLAIQGELQQLDDERRMQGRMPSINEPSPTSPMGLPKAKAGIGTVRFDLGGGIFDERDAEELEDDPVFGNVAGEALFKREAKKAKDEVDLLDLELKDPTKRRLSAKEREEILAIGAGLQESDPQHQALKKQLIDDEELADKEKRKYEAQKRLYELGTMGVNGFRERRLNERLNRTADQEQALREQEQAIRDREQAGISGRDLDAHQAEKAKIQEQRAMVERQKQSLGGILADAPQAQVAQPQKPASATLAEKLQGANLYGSATAAMSGTAFSDDKGISKRADGTWDLPMMTEIKETDGIIDSIGQGIKGAAALIGQKAGMREGSEDIKRVFDEFQRENNLTDEQVKTAWADLVKQEAPWDESEKTRVTSDGGVIINPATTDILDDAKLAAIVEQSGGSEQGKRAAIENAKAQRSTIVQDKLGAYEAAATAANATAGVADQLGLLGEKLISPTEYAQKTGKPMDKDLLLAYERDVIEKQGSAAKYIRSIASDFLLSANKVATKWLGLGAMATGSEKLAGMAAESSEGAAAIQQGKADTGIVGAIVQEGLSLAEMATLGRLTGGIGALTGSARVASIASNISTVLQSGAQSAGIEYAQARADGKDHAQAEEQAWKAGTNTALITGAFSMIGLGGAESALAGKKASEITLRDIFAKAGRDAIAKNTRSFALKIGKATLPEGAEEFADEVTSAFMSAKPDESLADAWQNAVSAFGVGAAIGGVVEVATSTGFGTKQKTDATLVTQGQSPVTPEEQRRMAEIASPAVMQDPAQAAQFVSAIREIDAAAASDPDNGQVIAARASGLLKIAAGKPLSLLTGAELDALQIDANGDSLVKDEQGNPIKGQPSQFITKANDQIIIRDEGINALKSIAPSAEGFVAMTETEAREKFTLPKFRVTSRSGNSIEVSAKDQNEARDKAAAMFDMGDMVDVVEQIAESPAAAVQQSAAGATPATPAATAAPAATPSPKSLEKAANLAKGDVSTYEKARQANPDLPDPAAAVQAAIQAGKPVSESMMQLATQGQPAPEGYALDKGVWKKQAKSKQSTVRGVIDKSKKSSKLTQDSLVEVDDSNVLVQMVDDKIQINVAAVEKRAAEMNLGEAGTRKWVSGIIDEEIRHLIQFRAAREMHKASGSKDPFDKWLRDRYSKIWQEEFVVKGKADIVRKLYGPNLDKMPEWKRAMEGERMLWQQKHRGQVTEVARLWKDAGKEIIENIKATLKQLKAMLKSGEISTDFQQDIDRLEAKLKELESVPAQPQKPAQAAQGFAIGDVVTGKVASKDPNESGSVVTGVVAQVGNGFLLIQMAENKRARMAFADVQSVAPKAESKPKGQKPDQKSLQEPANQPAASVPADQDSDKLSATLSFPSREAAQAFAKAWGRYSTRGSDISKTSADGATSVTVHGVTDADKQWIDSFVASQQEPAAQPEAETHTFYTPDPNEEVVAHGTVKVVSAAELEKMALAEISDEQARLRTAQNANSNAQIASIGANPDPRRLLAVDASSAEGPPTVYDGKVLAGNGRTMGLALAYKSGNAEKYKEATLKKAKQMGIEVDSSIDDPVMIRFATRFENGTPQRFADKSNSQGMLELSPAELAKVDAQTLGDFAAVETTDAGMFTAATIRDVAMALDKDGRKKVTRETNGEPSRKDVSERIRNAALAGLFDKADKPMTDLLGAMESDEGARLVSIIASSASRFMALDTDLSLANELTDALIEVQAGIRAVEEKTFKNLREWQKNRGQDLVARTDISEAGLWIVDKMVEAQKRPTILKGILSEYLNIAEIEQQQRNEAAQSDDIFGEQRQPRNILAEFIASPDGGASLASKAESLKGEADALANQGTPPSEEQVAGLEQQIAEAEQELPPQEPNKPKIELTDDEKLLEDASKGLFASDLEVESMPKPPSETAFMRAINRYEQETGTKRRREIPELWDSIYAEEEAVDAAYEKSLQKWLDSIPQNRPISFESEGRDGLPNYNVVTRNASDRNRPWRTTMFVTMPRPDWTIEEEIEYEDLFKKTRWYSNSPEYYKWNERLNDLGSRPIVLGATRIVPYTHEEFKTRIEAVMKAQQGSLDPKIGALFASDLGDAPTFSENIPAEKMPAMITAATAMIKGGVETPEGMANSVVRIEIKNDKIGALRRYSESIWSMFRAVKNTLQKDVDWAKAYAKADEDNGVTKPANQTKTKQKNDKPSSNNLESDRGNAGAGDGSGKNQLPIQPGTTGEAGGRVDDGGKISENAGSSGPLSANVPSSADGIAGITGVPVATSKPRAGATGNFGAGGRGGVDAGGVSPEPKGRADTAGNLTLSIIGDKAMGSSSAASQGKQVTGSPLTPEQQGDVDFAKRRLYDQKKPGVLFTNGTGTGKTFSGLGIIKDALDSGAKNILVVAPSDKVGSDWKATAQDFFGIQDAEQLKDTSDNGEGNRVVITTYANFGQNNSLIKRDWDMIVTDEAHYLGQSKEGDLTDALESLRALTWHKKGLRHRAFMMLPQPLAKEYLATSKMSSKERGKTLQDRLDAIRRMIDQNHELIKTQAKSEADRPKAVFLSATPFAYHFSLDYADGYLFDFGPEPENRRYNTPSARSRFYIENFGYRMRYGKLTVPDAAASTATGIMERRFAERLMKEGAMSGRALKVDRDYSRQFVLTETEIGTKIDEIMKLMHETPRFAPLREFLSLGDFLARRYLLEGIKARESVKRIKQHLSLGRKVVVFHDYKKGGAVNPLVPKQSLDVEIMITGDDGKQIPVNAAALFNEFKASIPDYDAVKRELDGLLSPIEMFQRAFPENGAIFNGSVSKGNRRELVKKFNKSGSGLDVLLVQRASGKEGISLHDTDGKHQRAFIDIGMPARPTDAIQGEGRIYRFGVKSDAVIEYLTTGTNTERWTFAQTIAQRSSTAENLAMGEAARALLQSYATGYNNAEALAPSNEQGKGGKEMDRARMEDNPYEVAKALYFTNQKKTSKNKAQEGVDYFATPEPLGYKMVEWADIQSGEKVLEPSGGHGAIARFFPDSTNRHAVEQSNELAGKLALNATDTQIHNMRFEDYNVVNKFNAVVMNPPFGTAGKTAMDHLIKALSHLRNGGRVVALIPNGSSMENRFNKWFESDDAKGYYLRAEIQLPSVTFQRAGTSVSTRIVIIDKVVAPKGIDLPYMPQANRDLSGATTAQELFDRLQDMTMPQRVDVSVYGPDETQKEEEAAAVNLITGGRGATLPKPESESNWSPAEFNHTKTGAPIFVAKIMRKLSRPEYDAALTQAKAWGGRYSSFKGGGAIPGFHFDSAEARDAFMNADSPSDTSLQASDLGDNTPPFYSQLSRVIAQKMPSVANAGQVMQIAMQNAKAEEVKWSGLQQALVGMQDEKGNVTKADVLKYLADEGAVKFEEVTQSDGPKSERFEIRPSGSQYVVWDVDGEQEASPKGDWQSTQRELEELQRLVAPTKYSQYTLPGGESYREVVLAMPDANPQSVSPSTAVIRKYQSQWDSLVAEKESFAWNDFEPRMKADEKLDDLHDKMVKETLANMPANYTSSHFPDVPNYVAHMRLNERVDATGKPGLFIEELQSDRHQEGRKKGYREAEKPKIDLSGFRFEPYGSGFQVIRNGMAIGNGTAFPTIEEAQKFAREFIGEASTRAFESENASKIADAPFRTTWPLALFKRALRDAVASNKDWIGWTVGDTQNSRYPGRPEEKKRGMAKFYDDILPKEIGKYVKQWGAKVEKGSLRNPDKRAIVQYKQVAQEMFGRPASDLSDSELRQVLAETSKRESDANSTPVWRVDITPEMRKGVEAGQALFASDLGDDLFSMAAKRQQEQPTKEVIAAYAETKEGQKAMQDVKVGRMNALRAYRALTAKRNKTGKLTGEEEQQLLDAEIALGQEMAFDMDAVRSVIPEQVAQAEAKRPTKTRDVQQEMQLGPERLSSGQMTLFASDLEEYSTRSSVLDGTRAYRFPGGLLTEPTNIALMASDLEAWHGTPHKVDKFKTDKIGTGEGAQAYGWGLYFAQSKNVGREYQTSLAGLRLGDGSVATPSWDDPRFLGVNELRKSKGDIEAARKRVIELSKNWPEQVAAFEEMVAKGPIEFVGNLYRVRLKVDDEELLDWDKPMSEQSEKVRAAIGRTLPNGGKLTDSLLGSQIYNAYSEAVAPSVMDSGWTSVSNVMFRGDSNVSGQAAASARFLAAGIKGIRYLDGNSRAKTGGEIIGAWQGDQSTMRDTGKGSWFARVKVANRSIGFSDGSSAAFTTSPPFKTEAEARAWAENAIAQGSYNYVIFDENDIEILEENGQPVSKRERAALFASDLGDMNPDRIAEIMEQQKQFGNAVKPGTNRAGVGDEEVRKVLDVFDIDYEERRMTQTRDMWVKGGEELAAKNPDGLVKKMIAVSRNEPNAGKITEAEVVGTQILIEKMVQEARGDFDKLMKAGVVIQAYRKARADVARVLASGWDRFMNPEERNRRFLANAILALPSKVAKEIDRRYDPAQVEDEMRKRLTERLRKIERVLNEMGVTVDEVLGKQFRLSPDKRNILKDISKDMSKAEKEALRMHAEHTPAAQIMKRTGLTRDQLEKLAKKSYDEALARMIEKVRAGMTAESAGLNASALMASPLNMTEEEIIAEAKKLVELGLGLSPKLHTASTKALVKRVRKPENEKKAVEKTADQVAARWTKKLQNEKAGVAKAVKKAQHAELVKLMRDHTKRDVLDFKKRVIKLGVTPEQATILDNECQEARARAKRLRYENVNKREQIKWARPEFNNGLIGYEFADKDLTQIKTLVAALTDAVKAVGKIESLSGEPRRKEEAMLAQLDAILGKYGTSALEVANSGKPLESYRFDVSDPTHVHIIANAIMAIDADFVDKAVEYNYFSLLSGPQTFLKNATSIFYSVYDATIARFVESSINAFFKNPMNATLGESKYILRAMGPMLSRARTNFMASLGAEMPFFEYDVLGVPPDLDNYTAGIGSYFRTAISGRKGRFLRIPTRALLATDDYVKTINACAEAGAMAYRICRAAGLKPGTTAFDQKMKELVNVPGSMAWRLAAEKAYRRTFTNALPGQTDQATGEKREVRTAGEAIGMVVGKANSLLNAKVDHMAAKVALTAIRLLFFPFVKVPYNIIATSLSYTPLSALEVAQLYVQSRDIKDPNDQMRAKAEVIERMTRTMQGTMLAALVMGFAGEGDDDDLEKPLLVTGSRPYSATKAGVREAAERLGIGPYTISWPMGNGKRGSFTYGGIEPLATILGTTVDSVKELKQANQGRKTYSEALSGAIGSFANQLSEKAFMQGVGDLFQMWKGEQDMTRFTADAFGRIVPNLIKQPMRELDPYMRAQTDELDKAILYALMPFGQKAEKVDVYGEPIKKGGFGLARIFDFTDAQTKEVREIDKMMWRYAQRNPGKDAVVLPSQADASYTPIPGKGSVEMTDNQAKMYRDLVGRQFAARVKSLALNYQNPTESDMKKVRAAIEASRDQAKRILRFNPNWK